MSAEGDQQRRPGAPDDTDGKRRLRAVSYPDPYLVTKLPLEATVNSGVIRLGERMLLGFIHRPYPDGTRVRVVYDEWLFAERLDDDEGEEEGDEQVETTVAKGARKQRKGGSSRSSGKGRAAGSGKSSVQGRSEGKGKAQSDEKGEGKGDSAESTAPVAAGKDKVDPAKRTEAAPPGSTGEPATDEEARSTGSEDPHDSHSANRFPDDFYDQERRAGGEPDGSADAWTETFERGERDD